MKRHSRFHRPKVLFSAGAFVLILAAGATARDGSGQDETSDVLLALFHKSRGKTAGKKIEINGSEWRLDPARSNAPSGRVKFVFKNVGQYPHAFAIEGKGVQVSSKVVDPGGTTSIEVDLKAAGDYRLICPLRGHAERGMVGVLTVKAKASAGY